MQLAVELKEVGSDDTEELDSGFVLALFLRDSYIIKMCLYVCSYMNSHIYSYMHACML